MLTCFMRLSQGAPEAEQIPHPLPNSGNFRQVSWADGHPLPDDSDRHKFRPEWEFTGEHLCQKIKLISINPLNFWSFVLRMPHLASFNVWFTFCKHCFLCYRQPKQTHVMLQWQFNRKTGFNMWNALHSYQLMLKCHQWSLVPNVDTISCLIVKKQNKNNLQDFGGLAELAHHCQVHIAESCVSCL